MVIVSSMSQRKDIIQQGYLCRIFFINNLLLYLLLSSNKLIKDRKEKKMALLAEKESGEESQLTDNPS